VLRVGYYFHFHEPSAPIHADSPVAVRLRFGPLGTGRAATMSALRRTTVHGHWEPHTGRLATMATLGAGLEE
jgi:hypothetical protein